MEETPEQFYSNIDYKVGRVLSSNEARYPSSELLTINGKVWQDTRFKQNYLDEFEKFYDMQFSKTISRSDLLAILEDKTYNGIAIGVIKDGLTKEESAAKYNIYNMKVTMTSNHAIKNSQEFIAANGGSYLATDDIVFKNIEEANKALLSDSPTNFSKNVLNKTTVILYLNNSTVNITSNGVAKT